MVSFSTLATSLLVAATAVQGTPIEKRAVGIVAPLGHGRIQVSQDGQVSPNGCLTTNGQWTTNYSNCALFDADGTGSIVGPSGACQLDASKNFACTGSGVATSWQAYIMYLWPTGSAPTLFRAPSVPSGSGTVALNQGSGSGPVNVYLSWVV